MCARTQFMTDSFLWAERPIMSKTNETMKHNASATAYYKRFISAICVSMDEDIYVFSNSIILFSPSKLNYNSVLSTTNLCISSLVLFKRGI